MIRTLISIAILTSAILLAPEAVQAFQDTGAGGGGGETTGSTGGNSGGTPGNVGDVGGNLELATDIPPVDIPEFEDNRNQGFVGATATNISDFGFVGRSSEFVGGASLGSFGGDVNTINGTGGGGNARGGNNGFAGGGAANGFEILRPKYIRTRLRLNFDAPRIPNELISSQFSSRLSQLPAVDGRSKINVSINNRIATLTGRTNTQQEAVRIERQLRLEPGVSRVINQLIYPGQ